MGGVISRAKALNMIILFKVAKATCNNRSMNKVQNAEVSDTTCDDKRCAARQINNSSLVINFH
jgi:hypothetical protein